MDDQQPPGFRRDVVLNWRLSARASAVLVRVSQRFSSDITLGHAGMVVDAKSILGILSLAHAAAKDDVIEKFGGPYLKAGSQLSITAHGPDASEAVRAIEDMLSRPDLDLDE